MKKGIYDLLFRIFYVIFLFGILLISLFIIVPAHIGNAAGGTFEPGSSKSVYRYLSEPKLIPLCIKAMSAVGAHKRFLRYLAENSFFDRNVKQYFRQKNDRKNKQRAYKYHKNHPFTGIFIVELSLNVL